MFNQIRKWAVASFIIHEKMFTADAGNSDFAANVTFQKQTNRFRVAHDNAVITDVPWT